MRKRAIQKEESFWQKLKSYRLHHNVYVLLALVAAVMLRVKLWQPI